MGSRFSIVAFIGTAVVAVLLLISAVGIVDAIDTHSGRGEHPSGKQSSMPLRLRRASPTARAAEEINGPSSGTGCTPPTVGYDCMSLAQYAVYQVTGITVPIDGEMLPGPNSTDWDGQGTYIASQATSARSRTATRGRRVLRRRRHVALRPLGHLGRRRVQETIWDALQAGTPVGSTRWPS